MGIPEEIQLPTIANVLHLQSFCFAYFLVFVVTSVTTQNNFLICDYFARKSDDLMENGRGIDICWYSYNGSVVQSSQAI